MPYERLSLDWMALSKAIGTVSQPDSFFSCDNLFKVDVRYLVGYVLKFCVLS